MATVVAGQRIEHVLGRADAPVTVVEFGDFECPYCAGAAPILRDLVQSSAGRVRLIFRNFPLFETHPHALTAALAAESAAYSGGPEVFWAMHDKLFAHQARLNDVDLRLYAELVGADPELATGNAAQQFVPVVQADYAAGIEAGVPATPTLYIDGVAYEGRIDTQSLLRATGTSSHPSAGEGGALAQRRRRPWRRG